MDVYVVIIAMLLAATELQGQLLRDDQDFSAQVRRDQVADKTCDETYDYFTYRGVDGILMVDRTKFYRTFGGTPHEMQCPIGSLYSMSARLCGCDVTIPRNDAVHDRCIRLQGDLQASDQLAGTQRTDAASNTFKGVSFKVAGFDDADYITSAGCYASSPANPTSVDFFDGNSLARSSINIKLGFRLPVGSPLGVYKIATNSPCASDSNTPSVDVSYVKAAGSVQLVVTLQLANNNPARGGSGERVLQIACTVVDISRGPGILPYVFTESAADNYVRISGVISSPNTISVTLRNSQIDGAVDAPASGFCSISTQAMPPRRSTSYFIAPRNCPLILGQGPNNGICIGEVEIERDC